MHRFRSMTAFLLILVLALPAARASSDGGSGANTDGANPACRDAGVLSGKLVTDICWSCIFPIRIMGVDIGGGRAPGKASSKSVCLCQDDAGVYHPGWVMGLWEPARLVELVRWPGCSPALGGITLPVSDKRLLGTGGEGEYDNADLAFYHYHYFAFPLLMMLDLFNPGRCMDGYVDMDLMYLSELDPTWNNDELAFFTNPEAAAVANPLAVAACAADAVAAAADRPLDAMWWCAGSWGTMYPFSGQEPTSDMVEDTNMLATKALAALHRRGLARLTMGDDALCRNPIEVMVPKSQYKWSMFFPVAETGGAHAIGKPTLMWGAGRQIPGVGEDAIYILWRWNDCCHTAL